MNLENFKLCYPRAIACADTCAAVIEKLATYTVYQVRLDGSLYSKEHLNNRDELIDWVDGSLGRYAKIRVENDLTGEAREFVDAGGKWERVA